MECQDTQAPLFPARSLGTGAPGNECCTLPPPQQPESIVHRLGLWRVQLGTGMELAHGLQSVTPKDTVPR